MTISSLAEKGLKISLPLLFLLCGAASLHAQTQNDFFAKDAALTVFSAGVTDQTDSKFMLLKAKKKDKEVQAAAPAEVKDPSVPQPDQTIAGAIPAPVAEHPQTANLSKREALIAKLGDPTVDEPVIAQENAPKTFKRMLAALDAGDEELAFQYARQHVRYMRNLQQTTKRAVMYQALGMEEEGMLSEGDWQNNPEYQAEKVFLKDQVDFDQEPADLAVSRRASMKSVDPRARMFMEKVIEAEGIKTDLSDASKEKTETTVEDKSMSREEQTERALAKRQFAGKAPIDTKGEVDIYFFLRANDKRSQQMGAEVQSLYSVLQANPKARLIGLTLDMEDPTAVQEFRKRSKAAFPIKNGSELAKRLNITKVPTTVVVARNTKNAAIEEGFRKFYYLDELVTYVQKGR